jgi:hypothetical protein
MTLKGAPYALRVTRRDGAEVVHVYRREPDANHRDRLQRLVTLGPLAAQAGEALLRRAVDGDANAPTPGAGRRGSGMGNPEPASPIARGRAKGKENGGHPSPAVRGRGRGRGLSPAWPLPVGPYRAVSAEWGARAALFGLVARGLRNPARLPLAARHVADMSGTDAAWWVGLATGPRADRGLRALRILTDAVA